MNRENVKGLFVFALGMSLLQAAVGNAAEVQESNAAKAKLAAIGNAKTIKYSPMIFGHFIEHFDTQVYGGIFSRARHSLTKTGFAKTLSRR